MLELAARSLRAAMTFESYSQYSLSFEQLPILVFPFLFGGDMPRPYWGMWNIIEVSGYVGIAPLMLALASPSLVRRQWRAGFWLAVAIVSLVLALGTETPLASVMYRLPVYNLLRAPARNLFELDFALAVLAAMALTAASRRALLRGAAAVTVLITILAAAALVIPDRLWLSLATMTKGPEVARELFDALPRSHAVWLPLVFTVASLVAIVSVARRRSPARVAVLVAVQLADLFYFGSMMGQMYPDQPWVLQRPELIKAIDGLPVDRAAERIVVLSNDTEAVDLRPQLWGVRLVNGYDSMPVERYAQFAAGMVYSGQIVPKRAFAKPLFLDLLNARWVMVRTPARAPATEELASALADPSRWVMQRQTSQYTILENRQARPRAWLVGRTQAVDADTALSVVRTGRLPNGVPFDPSVVAVVEDAPPRRDGGGAQPGTVTITAETTATMELVTNTSAPAFLVVSEIHYPGWHAYLDGAEVPLVRTDAVLRGVDIPPGEHRVRMEFAPLSLRIGVAVSVLTVAGLIGAALVAGRTRRRAAARAAAWHPAATASARAAGGAKLG
jgi:hypothetical protein